MKTILGFIVIVALFLFATRMTYNKILLPRILKSTKPKERDILTTLISCRLLAQNEPFLSSNQIQSIHNDGYPISNDELITICAASLFRIYIFKTVTLWNDPQLTRITLNVIQSNFPDEWEILSSMFDFEVSNRYKYKTKDDAMKYTSAWIASSLILTPCDASKSISQSFYNRLIQSRI